MAGLTKEQRAAKAAAEAAGQGAGASAAPAVDADLVRMEKDGEVLDVHRTCVADHKSLGWKPVE